MVVKLSFILIFELNNGYLNIFIVRLTVVGDGPNCINIATSNNFRRVLMTKLNSMSANFTNLT